MAEIGLTALLLGILVVALIAMQEGAKALIICNMDSNQLAQCLPAVQAPPKPPTKGCCNTIRKADMHCLCTYKPILPTLGINPELAMALPKKCDLNPPPQCSEVRCVLVILLRSFLFVF